MSFNIKASKNHCQSDEFCAVLSMVKEGWHAAIPTQSHDATMSKSL